MTRDIQGILESWPKKTAPKTLGESNTAPAGAGEHVSNWQVALK
jgi:hypothetical protein